MYRTEEDTEPIPEDDPEYPKDSLGNPMLRAGIEKTVSLRYIPAQIIKVVSITQKFISRTKINGKHEHKTIRGIINGMFRNSPYSPEPEALATFAWKKYGLYMPANRIVQELKRKGIHIKRGTMTGWLARGSKYLELLMPFYLEKLSEGMVLQADETVVITQIHKNSQKEQAPDIKHYVWVYLTSKFALQQAVIYDAGDLTRRITNAEQFLKNFKGFLNSDAYPAYLKLKTVIHVFCLIHARRKFVECIPANSGKASPEITYVLETFTSIFNFESSFQEMTADERKAAREQHIRPLMFKIKEKCEEIRSDHSLSGKSKINIAVSYFLNHWEELNAFFMHGNIPIHNQASELCVKPLKLGLKNYLTFGSISGAQTACLYLSIFQTAMKNGLDPVKYLSYIFTKCMENPDKLDDPEFMVGLLAWNSEIMRKCADAEHKDQYNDPAWMEDYQRRVKEEQITVSSFRTDFETALEQQNTNLEEKKKVAKKETAEKSKKTRNENRQRKEKKQVLLDTFNENKSALTSVTEDTALPPATDHNSDVSDNVQLE